MKRALGTRLLLAGAALLGTLLVGEGVLSLLGRPTLGQRLAAQALAARPRWDEERIAAAARTPGFYRSHPDPRVSYVLKAETEFDILGGRGHADALGLRARPAGAHAYDDPAALRVVVLGDSVAFGYGLGDQEVLAARLEELLARARPPSAPPVVCRTVALPGWNWRNPLAFLRDHFDELDPALVLHLPIANDLASSRQVDEGGHTGWAPDLGERDPWLVASSDFGFGIRNYLLRQAQAGQARLTEEELGPEVLGADLSPESSRRFDAMAAAELELETFLRAQGRRLAIVHYERGPMIASLSARQLALGLEAPLVPFLGTPLRTDTLLVDGHPNAATIEALAVVVARALDEHGLLALDPARPLPALAPELARRLVPPLTPAGWAQLAGESRARALAQLVARIDRKTGDGALQVYGNLSPMGYVGARLVAVLRGGCRAVRVAVEPLEDRPDLYPLALAVELAGRPAGTLVVTAGAPAEATFPLVLAGQRPDDSPLEVRLVPERWGVVQRERRTLLASCRLLVLEGLAELGEAQRLVSSPATR